MNKGFGDDFWRNLPNGMALGQQTDYAIAKALGLARYVVSKARHRYGIAQCESRHCGRVGLRDNFPSDAELRRQNEASARRRALEVASAEVLTAGSGWMGGDFVDEDQIAEDRRRARHAYRVKAGRERRAQG